MPANWWRSLIGVATLVGFVFTFSFVVQPGRSMPWSASASAAKAELEGLDLPEMGQLGYPEFELKAASGQARESCRPNW